MASKKTLTPAAQATLLQTLKTRFDKFSNRHKAVKWEELQKRLEKKPDTLWTIEQMEASGGEPDLVIFDGAWFYADCSAESPKDRRSLCYDRASLDARKENKPSGSALEMAEEIGIGLLSEAQYRALQEFGPFDTKTSSWIETPPSVREKDGALFGDFRYGQTFIYHNGASSYYAARGFRGAIKI